jgi:hypothetical protein
MATTFKSAEIAHELADKLKIRAAALSLEVVESFDTDSNPLITVQPADDHALVAGDVGCMIKVAPVDWPLAKDALGNTAISYGPQRVMVLMENAAGDTGALLALQNFLAMILGECLQTGCKLELYGMKNTHAVIAAGFTTTVSGNNLGLQGSFQSLYYPMISSQ